MFKAIHAPNFKEFQVETLVENHVIFQNYTMKRILVGNVHIMQHESVSVRPAYARQLSYAIRTSDTKAESVLKVAHFRYMYKMSKIS